MTYPLVLVTTADTDDRVVPGHSFKYVAALQHAEPRGAPHLIRIETRAGHGSGKPTDMIIEEYADVWAFLAHHTGLLIFLRAIRAIEVYLGRKVPAGRAISSRDDTRSRAT